MKNLFAFSLFVLVMVSCNSGSTENTGADDSNSDTTAVDTLALDTLAILEDPTRPKVDVDKLLAKTEDWILACPINIDSNFIQEKKDYLEGSDYNLTYKEAYFLKHQMVKNQPTEMASYDITTFIKMDSLIAFNKMDKYQDEIDLGMARYSIGNAFSRIKISEESYLLIWMTDYATYEACPYGWGTCVWGTLFTNDMPLNTVLLGEESGGGDPPSWGETHVSSKVTSNKIIIKSLQKWGEEDYDSGEDIIETTKSTIEIEITPTGLVLVKETEG